MKRIDLNLLYVFEALLHERSVTKAARRVGITQPATSNALSRLRGLFNDPLFVRTPEGMIPTDRALEIGRSVLAALNEVDAALGEGQFDPMTTRWHVQIGMTDYTSFVLLPALLRRLRVAAPSLHVSIVPVTRRNASAQLDRGEIALACCIAPDLPYWQRSETLFTDRWVCLCSKDNPLACSPLTREAYAAAQHLNVSTHGALSHDLDSHLARDNLSRTVVGSLSHFLVAPWTIRGTDMVVTLAERLCDANADMLGLVKLDLPFADPRFAVDTVWLRRDEAQPRLTWLREQIRNSI